MLGNMKPFDGYGDLESVTQGGLHDINLRLFWWVDGDVAVYPSVLTVLV